MSYQWCYNAGSVWVPLDKNTQVAIERLWRQSSADWVYVATFRDQAYVNGASLYIYYNGANYYLTRTC
ncbi:hypothetical protein BJ944DRAFT_260589 [Cunninghamella echinulata]|nr:hypothetical protein BJ944DRAFT_260589 [Cunninghamella echinulata]